MGKNYDVSVKNSGGTSGIANSAMGRHAKTATAVDKKSGRETTAYGSTADKARANLDKKLGK